MSLFKVVYFESLHHKNYYHAADLVTLDGMGLGVLFMGHEIVIRY